MHIYVSLSWKSLVSVIGMAQAALCHQCVAVCCSVLQCVGCMNVQSWQSMYTYSYIYMYIHTYIHTYIQTYIRSLSWMHECAIVCMSVCMYVYTYVHTYICVYYRCHVSRRRRWLALHKSRSLMTDWGRGRNKLPSWRGQSSHVIGDVTWRICN